MKSPILAQHGFGKTTKIQDGLAVGSITGVVLSPRDETPDTLEAFAKELRGQFPDAMLLFDPQFYASVVSPANLGHLAEYKQYFRPGLTRGNFVSPRKLREYAKATLGYQRGLPLSRLTSPTICFDDFSDPWSQIALQLADASVEHHVTIESPPPLLVSLVFSESGLSNAAGVEEFLDLATGLPVAGFYLVVKRDLQGYRANFRPETLKQLLYLVYALAEVNDLEVVCGYSDLAGVLLRAVGATACASGWHGSLRQFTLARFQPSKGGRSPRARYTSRPLLNSILVSDLDMLYQLGRLGETLSGTPEEAPLGTSKPPSNASWTPTVSTLHHWRVLADLAASVSTGTVGEKLDAAVKLIKDAKGTYALLENAGATFETGCDAGHLEQWLEAVKLFRVAAGV
ncbi:MAG: hypothetical protein QME96_05430 [Myxococcota bacterium]|nr:hypothetical protein [Myxococcota bacterium]